MDTDWSAHVGHGPARPACLDALAHLRRGFDLGNTDAHASYEPAGPDRGFVLEGIAAALTLRGEREAVAALLTRPQAVEVSFASIGRGLAQGLGATAWGHQGLFEADGVGFAAALVFTRRTLDLRAPLPVADAHRDWAHHGVGRALWYLTGGDPLELTTITRGAPPRRREWWWHGIVAAAIMAPGPDPERVRRQADRLGVPLANGVALGRATLDALGAWTDVRRRAVHALEGS